MGLEVAGDVDGLAELTVNGIDEFGGLLRLLLIGINEEVAVHVGLELLGHAFGFGAEAATIRRKIADEEPIGIDLIFGKEPVGDGRRKRVLDSGIAEATMFMTADGGGALRFVPADKLDIEDGFDFGKTSEIVKTKAGGVGCIKSFLEGQFFVGEFLVEDGLELLISHVIPPI